MPRSQFRSVRLTAFVLSAAVAPIASAAVSSQPFTTVARSGTQASGFGVGINYSSFTPSFHFNDTGGYAFKARLTGTGISTSNDDVLYVGQLGSAPTIAIREGSAAPGLPGLTFDFLAGNYVYNNQGQLALLGGALGTGGGAVHWLRAANGTWSVAAREGAAAPDMSGHTYGTFFYPLTLNQAGQLSYKVSLNPGIQYPHDALYSGTPGNVRLLATTGQQVPGAPAGTTFGTILSYGSFTSGGAGFNAFLNVNGGNGGDAIFVGKNGTLTTVARWNTPAPGMPAGSTHVDYSDPYPTASGNVTFSSRVNVPGTGETRVLYAGPLASPQVVRKTGDAAPGLPAGVQFSQFYQPMMTEGGILIAPARLQGPGITTFNNDDALFVGTASNLKLVLQTGTQAPGVAAGVLFDSFEGPSMGGTGQMAFNESGQVALLTHLTGTGVSLGNDEAIYATTPTGELVLIARKGDFVTIDGVQRGITDLAMIGNGDWEGLGTSFTEDGRLGLWMSFSNGSSGVFVTQVPVPEPTAAAGVALGAAPLLLRRRRPH